MSTCSSFRCIRGLSYLQVQVFRCFIQICYGRSMRIKRVIILYWLALLEPVQELCAPPNSWLHSSHIILLHYQNLELQTCLAINSNSKIQKKKIQEFFCTNLPLWRGWLLYSCSKPAAAAAADGCCSKRILHKVFFYWVNFFGAWTRQIDVQNASFLWFVFWIFSHNFST